MNQILACIIAALPGLCTLIALVVGGIRYRKYGDEIRKRVEIDFANKRAQGGIHSYLHKRPDKRVAYETFGIPLCISFFVNMIILFVIFWIF